MKIKLFILNKDQNYLKKNQRILINHMALIII